MVHPGSLARGQAKGKRSCLPKRGRSPGGARRVAPCQGLEPGRRTMPSVACTLQLRPSGRILGMHSASTAPAPVGERQDEVHVEAAGLAEVDVLAGRMPGQPDIPVSPPREPVPHHSFCEVGGEVGRCVEDGVAGVSRAKPGIGGTGAQRRRQMARRHDPPGGGQGALQQCRFNPVPRIADPTHVNVSPNPGAARSTSPIRPDFSSSRGFATVSSNGHS